MTESVGVRAPARAAVPLHRNWRFQVFWAGAVSSLLGLRIAGLAYPLLILARTGSPATAGAFGAVQTGTMLVLAVPGGAVADRANRRTVLAGALGLQAAAVAGVPVAMALHGLTVAQLMGTAVLLGAGTAFGGPVRMLALRSLVPPEQLSRALVQEEVRTSGGSLLGTPLGGILYALGSGLPFVASAAGCVLAVTSILVVRFDGRAARPAGRRRGDFLSGLRILWAGRLLRSVLFLVAGLGVVSAALTLVVIVRLQHDGASSRVTGLVLAADALGGVLGALLTGRLHAALAPGRLLLAVSGCVVPLLLLVAVPWGTGRLMLLLALIALGRPSLTVMLDILVFRQVDDAVRGRVIATTVALVGVGTPVGSVLAGALLQFAAPPVAPIVLAGVLCVPLVTAGFSKELRGASWPVD
ncbi:MFS transporter [Streptomyces fuscichromogenes]|uniref:MFS transporter n=1 Tax=Streptomyces fuscichromogenes TaxID=1324013 RepID=UPI0037FC61BC